MLLREKQCLCVSMIIVVWINLDVWCETIRQFRRKGQNGSSVAMHGIIGCMNTM